MIRALSLALILLAGPARGDDWRDTQRMLDRQKRDSETYVREADRAVKQDYSPNPRATARGQERPEAPVPTARWTPPKASPRICEELLALARRSPIDRLTLEGHLGWAPEEMRQPEWNGYWMWERVEYYHRRRCRFPPPELGRLVAVAGKPVPRAPTVAAPARTAAPAPRRPAKPPGRPFILERAARERRTQQPLGELDCHSQPGWCIRVPPAKVK